MSESHIDPVRDRVGVYYKYKSSNYRDECGSCGRGFHGHRWEAHHVLPCVVFKELAPFVNECLGVTNYNVNKPYSMAGLPNLSSFILYFQNDPTVPIDTSKEKVTAMKKWGTIKKKDNENRIPITFPGNFPCHNPVNFGHAIYNEDVSGYLKKNIWNELMRKKREDKHFKPKDVKGKLEDAKTHFWNILVSRGSGVGGGGLSGVESNMRNRYGKAKNGWWKPLCMADVASEPVSPSLFKKK